MMATRTDSVARPARKGERILGRETGFRLLPFLGPAFIACIAYIDPGNFATNIAGGSKYGYTLVWVIVAANLMAMLIQTLSAKLGIATGRNLPELCRERFSRRTSTLLWVQAEAIAMATDLAEFLGAAPFPIHGRRRDHRDGDRRADQHRHARDGRQRLPRLRPAERRLARGRAPYPRADPRQRRQHALRARAALLRSLELGGRHARRSDRDAGLHRPPHSGVRAARRDDAAGLRRDRDRRRSLAHARPEPGRALVR